MKKIFLSVFFLIPNLYAVELLQAEYDRRNQTLILDVVYIGGLKTHNFSLDFDNCTRQDGINQIASRLVDSGYDDTGRQEIFETVVLPLSSLPCRPATLWIRSGKFSQKSVWVD